MAEKNEKSQLISDAVTDSNTVTEKKVFICHPDNPDPLTEFYYSDYKRIVFQNSITTLVSCLESAPSIQVICRNNFSLDDNDVTDIGEKIKECNIIILVCCPALVYLLSEQADDEIILDETRTLVELKMIQGESFASNRIKIIPVVINNTADDIKKNIPNFIYTYPVRICISTPAYGEFECWPAQKRSIDHLINIIHETDIVCPDPGMISPVSEFEAVDMEWCLYFIDQYGIDFIALIFEDRNVITDKDTLESYLEPKEANLNFRELLRLWLRRLRKNSQRDSLFDELKILMRLLGREDLMYQLKEQFEVYKIQVYNYQNRVVSQTTTVQHEQAKPLKKLP